MGRVNFSFSPPSFSVAPQNQQQNLLPMRLTHDEGKGAEGLA